MINEAITRFLGILCYPFSTILAYEQDTLQKYYETKDKKKEKYNVYNAVEYFARQFYQVRNLDEVHLLVNKLYLNNIDRLKDEKKPMVMFYLETWSKLAKALISHRDGKVVYKYWENEDDTKFLGGFAQHNKILVFHTLNRVIPLDLIVVKYLLDNGQDRYSLQNFYGQVNLADSQIDEVLRKGVAENHVHVGGSVSFSVLWNQIVKPYIGSEALRLEPPQDPFYSAQHKIYTYSLVAGIIRVVLAQYIREDRELLEPLVIGMSTSIINKEHYSKENDYNKENNYHYVELKELIISVIHHEAPLIWLQKCGINDYRETAKIRGLFIRLWEKLSQLLDLSEEAFKKDVVKYILNEANEQITGESLFLYESMKWMQENINDEVFSGLFIQYIRIKHHIFGAYVQENGIKGLYYFQRMYRLNSKALQSCAQSQEFWELVMREQFQNSNIQKVEFRTSIGQREDILHKSLLEFLKAYRSILYTDYCDYDGEEYIPIKRFPRIGIVFHLLKSEDIDFEQKCWMEALQSEEGTEVYCKHVQFGQAQEIYKKEIELLKKVRNKYPELSRYLVGLDAASLENAMPIWALTSAYDYARDSKEDKLFLETCKVPLQSLKFTCHVGEEFRHILSGLRRIDEAVTYFKFHAGDRIGHGTALGVDMDEWRKRNPVVIMPRIEILENYIWAWKILSENAHEAKADTLAYLEYEIYKLCKQIYEYTEGITTYILVEAYKKSFTKKKLEHFDRDEGQNVNKIFCRDVTHREAIIWNEEKLVQARHCVHYIKRMNECVHYEVTNQEIMIAKEIQDILKKKLSQKGIVVEINPTSNVAIGEIETLFQHHAYTINHFMKEESNVMLCVNSDDPSVFNTNVSNEFAYIYYGLMEQGCGKEVALQWIDKLRQNGIQSSFIQILESDELWLRKLNRLIAQMEGENVHYY